MYKQALPSSRALVGGVLVPGLHASHILARVVVPLMAAGRSSAVGGGVSDAGDGEGSAAGGEGSAAVGGGSAAGGGGN